MNVRTNICYFQRLTNFALETGGVFAVAVQTDIDARISLVIPAYNQATGFLEM